MDRHRFQTIRQITPTPPTLLLRHPRRSSSYNEHSTRAASNLRKRARIPRAHVSPSKGSSALEPVTPLHPRNSGSSAVALADTAIDAFAPLPAPAGDFEPSELDNNPRYLVLPNFTSRFLPTPRAVSVYLPEAYLTDPTRHFPVFLLHDGQNLFDGRTSYVPRHTWRAHTTADELTRAGLIEPVILVGVAHAGSRRMAEYTPTRDSRLGGGESHRYGRLITEELLPLLRHSFRILPGPQNCALGGSSLGGLVSLAIALEHRSLFGKLAVLSPSVWWNHRSILHLVNHARPVPPLRVWLDMGTAEGLRHLRDADLLHRRFRLRGWREGVDLRYLRVPGAVHSEDAWASRFDQVLRFLFPAS